MAWIEQPSGFLHQEQMAPELALALSRLDGRRRLDELGPVVETPAHLDVVRRLLERGFFAIG